MIRSQSFLSWLDDMTDTEDDQQNLKVVRSQNCSPLTAVQSCTKLYSECSKIKAGQAMAEQARQQCRRFTKYCTH